MGPVSPPGPLTAATHSADVSTLIAQGPRERQEDAVSAASDDSDGSWVIAVADGVGGVAGGELAAPAALGAVPGRISSDEEMLDAFAAANAAVRGLAPPESPYDDDEDLPGIWGAEPVTTLAVAAWTPAGGLVAASVGDSMVFAVPLQPGRGWHSDTHKMAAGTQVIGEFACARPAAAESLREMIRYLSDNMTRADTDRLCEAGLLVAALSDGAYSGYMSRRAGLWFSDNPDDNSIGFLLDGRARASASAAAKAVMRRAKRSRLKDNASVAVARMAPQAVS